ncbi:PREDICTED: uncharacterized protein LOC104596336 isoform X2 [Nelumbo nucifera]|uniref:Uncharacterized protein LOC104596336 isoform X2 n=1 Tax=Nelumbo nucifera TaxID=4432 RepID=A0A1U7ZUA4_NELNU|nr:PREDICTED: uncharacterized protein LOC104596336 isoform X2 [Nelumbo nucifera]
MYFRFRGIIHHHTQQQGHVSIRPADVSDPTGRVVLPGREKKDDRTLESNMDDFNIFGSLRIGPIIKGNISNMCAWLKSQIIGDKAEFESPFGRRRITYSDHTASGRLLRFVEEFLEREVLPFYGNTHTVDSYVGLHTSELVHQAAQYIKHCMGAGPQDALLFCGSGTTAAVKRLQEVMGIAVPSVLRSRFVSCLADSERWVVFTGPYEHHSNLLSWRQSLADVVEIGVDESGLVDIASLVDALKSPQYAGRPKLGSFSACSNVTGIYADTRELARVLHEHGAYACFDFACSGPYVDIQMRTGEVDGYDAVFLSPHKFIGGPGSPGILVMSKELYRLKGCPPSTSGGGTVRYVNGYDDKHTLYSEDLEEREDAGTPGIVQKIRAALAFRVKDYFMGYGGLICCQESKLIEKALNRLLESPNVHILGNIRIQRQPIVSFLIYPNVARGKHLHCRFVTKLLNDVFGIQARGGCACAGPYGHVLLHISRARAELIRSTVEKGYEGVKPGWTRVSFSYYTSMDEMEFVADAVEFVGKYGHRFLPLYKFDWRTGDWSFDKTNRTYQDAINGLLTESNTNTKGGCTCTDKERYIEYMAVAKQVANALPDSREEPYQLPDYIDPELVTFMI